MKHLIDGKKKFEEKKAQRIEKQRSNLTKNLLAYEKRKNKELTQKCQALEKEIEKEKDENHYPTDTQEILQMSLEINALSPNIYAMLASSGLPFPPKSTIDKMISNIIDKIPEQLRDLNNVTNIVDIWKDHNHISKSNTIFACLAVDAIYFTPNVELNKDSVFNGLIFSQDDEIIISKNIFKNFLKNPNDFQNFLSLNADKIIKAAFVFHVQPYNPIYNNFVVHIKAAVNGKANDEIILSLNYIKEVLKNRNITILSYSFDGDSAYSCLHDEYFLSYINTVIKNGFITFLKTRKFKISGDFLHLIKRIRYRLFGVDIFAGFTVSQNFFNVEKLKKIFPNLSNIIWSDELITKMHDSLPLILFDPCNFLYLLENKYFVEAAFWMPVSLSILAFDGKDIGYSNRMYLLQISFFFLFIIMIKKITHKKLNCLKQKKVEKSYNFIRQEF